MSQRQILFYIQKMSTINVFPLNDNETRKYSVSQPSPSMLNVRGPLTHVLLYDTNEFLL